MFTLTRQDTAVLKGIAICAMLCHHLYAFPPNTVERYHGLLLWIGILGKICVALFLFCSGYGLASHYKPISLKEDIKFILRRLVKFFANYWVIFAIFVPITILVSHRSLADAYGQESNVIVCLLRDIMGLQCYESYNPTWWFNQLIIILYLLFPLLYRVVYIKPWLAILVGIVITLAHLYIPYNPADICTWQLPFVIGIVWKLYEAKFPTLQEWISNHKYVFAISSLALMIVLIIIRMYPIIPHWKGVKVDGFLSCAIALCVVSMLRYMQYVSAALAFLGKHSINIYLTHTFVNAFWCPQLLHTGEWMRGGGNFIVLMIICLLVSIIIEFLKEKIRFYELVNIITKHI